MEEYDFQLDTILGRIRKDRVKRVGLQFPEGLKKYAVEIAREIEERTNTETIIFIDPCYGACDLKETDIEKLDLDLIIHFGHKRLQ